MSEPSRFSKVRSRTLKASIAGLIVVLVVLVTLFASGTLTVQRQIGASGQIAAIGVEVYTDATLTTPLTSIDWGIVSPGASVTRHAFVKNAGNVPCTLSLSVGNWTPPEAAPYISVTWDAQNSGIQANASAQVIFYLTVSDSIQNITQFNAFMTVTGASS